jgi:hypothetical protein
VTCCVWLAMARNSWLQMLGRGACLALIVVAAVTGAAVSAPSMSTIPDVMEQSGDPVVISWSGVEDASYWDTVAVFASATSEVPIGYVFVNVSSTWESGTGNITLPGLVNMRSAYVFKYLQVWGGTQTLVGFRWGLP